MMGGGKAGWRSRVGRMAAMQAGGAISRTGTLWSSWGTALEAKGSGGTIGRRNAYERHKGGA